METTYLNTPVGTLEINGDIDGLAFVNFIDPEESESKIIPESLQNTVQQLSEYFEGNRTNFQLKLYGL